MIYKVHSQSPLNIAHMSEKQWYRYLLEENVTMFMEEPEVLRKLIPCRVETKFPQINWDCSWRRARLRGLGPELSSFLFKLLHNLLPTQARLARTGAIFSGACKLCQSGAEESALHALIQCPANQGAGLAIVQGLPTPPQDDDHLQEVLLLQLDLEDSLELPVVWYLATAWFSIWESRKVGKLPELYKVRADMEAQVNLLRETRFIEAAETIRLLYSKL